MWQQNHPGAVYDIEGSRVSPAPGGGDQCNGLAELVSRAGRHGDASTGFGQRLGEDSSDPRSRSGNHRHPAGNAWGRGVSLTLEWEPGDVTLGLA